jgi:hypothetical protein
MLEGGGLRAQKRRESKLPFTALQSHAHIESNLKAARGSPLGIKPHPDFDEGPVNEKVVVVETLTHSINRRHGGSSRVDRTVSPRYPYGWFFLHSHYELSLCLT